VRERGSAQAWARELARGGLGAGARGGLERCLACAQAWERELPRAQAWLQ